MQEKRSAEADTIGCLENDDSSRPVGLLAFVVFEAAKAVLVNAVPHASVARFCDLRLIKAGDCVAICLKGCVVRTPGEIADRTFSG